MEWRIEIVTKRRIRTLVCVRDTLRPHLLSVSFVGPHLPVRHLYRTSRLGTCGTSVPVR